MQSAAGQCLVQLTTADSVFLSKTPEGATLLKQKHFSGAFQGWLISVIAWMDVQVVKIGKMNKSPSLQAC